MARITTKDLAEILEKVQAQLAALAAKVEQLEAAGVTAQPPAAEAAVETPEATVPPPPPEPVKAELTDEELLAISAAIAAFMGERVRIKQIRLLGSHSWAQQGRVWIQASHNLHN